MNFNEEDLKKFTEEYKANEVAINLIQEEIQKLQEKCAPLIKRNNELTEAIHKTMEAEKLEEFKTPYANISYTHSVSTIVPEGFDKFDVLPTQLWNTKTTTSTTVSKNDMKKYIQESEENAQAMAELGIVLQENKSIKIK